MSRAPRLTDATLRAALMPAPGAAAPAGLLASISADIRRTPQQRSRLGLPWSIARPALLDTPRGRQLVLVLAAACLLAALLGGALVGARLLAPPMPRDNLVPTGIETLTTAGGLVDRVIVDGVGGHWAIGAGQITQFDPVTGRRRTWTVSDDATFAATVVAPSRDGGVWLWDGASIRRFDGQRFTATIPATSTSPMSLAEGPDGSLWASSWDGALQRWDGTRWIPAPPGRPTDMAVQLLPLGTDDVWVDNPSSTSLAGGGPPGGGISHLVGGSWATYDGSDNAILGGTIGAIVRVADGSIWVTADLHPDIARFDGRTWTTIPGPGFEPWWLEAASDGSVWAVTGQVSTLAVARYRDGTWTRYGADDGLAGSELGHISVTPAGAFLGTNAGLFHFDGETWVRLWQEEPAAIGWRALVAVSREEAWTSDGRGIWHVVGRSWEGPLHPTGLESARVRALALGPSGELWAATDQGVAVLRNGRWTTAWVGDASTFAIGPDGTAWVGGDGQVIVRLAASGETFEAQKISCPVGTSSLAVATDGSVYLGDFAYTRLFPGLARYDGRSCTKLDPLGDGSTPDVVGIAAHPDGGVVARLLLTTAGYPGGGRWTSVLARVDGSHFSEIERRSPVGGVCGGFAVAPDGAIWRSTWSCRGIERFDGTRWAEVVGGFDVGDIIAVTPDGALYFSGLSGLQRYAPGPARKPPTPEEGSP